ncbi:uncharacterized protein TNCV_415511 [Trichonephila clavipes]|nr:uncharacterized protein TNCV_415511 [Trichonephila clavipes]
MTAQRYVHPATTCVATHATAPRSHFSTRQCSASHGKGHKTVPALLQPFLGLPDPQVCLQSSISGIIWDGELGIPNDPGYERRLQHIWNEMSQNIIQNLCTSMPDRITSCIRARMGSTGGSTAQDGPWSSQEAFSRLTFFLLVFFNS